MRFAGLLVAFTAAYGTASLAAVSLGIVGMGEALTRTVSVGGAFALGWLFRGPE